MPVDSFVTSMAANNSTIYYGMSNGAISVGQTGSIAGGIAIVAMLYVFFKFFLAGSVTRARKLLDKNANRNAVYDHILKNPGSTLYDISRALGMNIGTTRYHLYILGMSHYIVTHYTGVKYVRYFTNSGSYSKEEQSIISLVRRDVMRKILGLLIERPGLSNRQISQALNTPESSVSKYMKELSSGGIVMKSPMGSYSIKAEYQPLIANALGHTGMSG
jgi:predicted transcriptional regulator